MPKFLEEVTRDYNVTLKYDRNEKILKICGEKRFIVKRLIDCLLFNFKELMPEVRDVVCLKEDI